MSKEFVLPNNQIRLVGFDVWQTILKINYNFSSARKKIFYEELKNYSSPVIGFKTFCDNFDKMKTETEITSERTGNHIGFEQRIANLCKACNMHVPQAIIADLSKKQSFLFTAHPPSLMSQSIGHFFQQLKKAGFTVAVISNTGLIESRHVRSALDTHELTELIDYQIYSDEVGATKPSPIIFSRLLDLTNCKPSELLFIGDNYNADGMGCTQIGGTSILTPLDDSGINIIKHTLCLK